jgi:2-polyprenyl-6-hydroxyphenyl methylase / 3-demethylubiquinone-9 3-methyltransferase
MTEPIAIAPGMPDASPANADAAELAKFQALASRWWDPSSEFRPLHEINPLRLRWIKNHLGFENRSGGLSGKRAIDIGCGGGILAESMAREGAVVRGIDLADKPLQVARLHALETGTQLDYEKISAEAIALREPASVDVVTCMEMLEHVPQPESTIKACSELVKPGGWVFMSTLNRNPKSFLFAIVGAEYVLRLLPRGTHDYSKFIRPSELIRAARDCGLEMVELIGLTYNPITRIYKLTAGDVDVNYLVAFRKVS